MTSSEEFIEFATVTSPRLRRTAFLLCGDWYTAEDLAQATLAKVFASWRRISRKDAAASYATRTLVNTYLADRRRKRVGEVLTGTLPERPVQEHTPGVADRAGLHRGSPVTRVTARTVTRFVNGQKSTL